MGLQSLVVRAFAVAVLTAAPAAAFAEPNSSTNFESGKPGEIIVPVSIGGAGPYRFLLDTGASHTSITARLAASLAAVPVAKAPLTTSAGTETYLIVQLADVHVGAISADSVLATALPRSAADALGPKVDGVIGQDLLSTFNYTLDYRRHRVIWGDEEERPGAIRLTLETSDGRVLVRLPQQGNGDCQVRFVPDSGAAGMVLFDRGQGTPLVVTPSEMRFGVQSLTGAISVPAVTLRQLQIGRTTLHDQQAALVRIDKDGPDRGDGLLPLWIFSRVRFDNRDGYLEIE